MGVIQGKAIIITGASSGIGEATARLLAREGASLALVARRQERLLSLKADLEKTGDPVLQTSAGKSVIIPADITLPQDRERIIATTLQTFGRIDGLVNNAGYGHRGPVELVPVEAIRQNFETNLFSLIALTQAVIPTMRKQGTGRIVHVGSVAGKIARPLSSIYDATKHALEAITDGLRGELSIFGIQVILIEPGFILTEFLEASDRISRPILDRAGPYAPYFSDLSLTRQRARSIAGRPDQIATLILRAFKDEKPRFRYAAPGHAHLFLAMKRFLPERIFDYFIMRSVGLQKAKRSSAG
ncbi:MAG: SDR family NAD(P)-dependent oxidoreductase [Terriglobia bacterium]